MNDVLAAPSGTNSLGPTPSAPGLSSVYCRAVIEISNNCSRSCLYCGMRGANSTLERYRLDSREVLAAAREASSNGVKILMLQGGDDFRYDLPALAKTITAVRSSFQDVILCLGDRPVEDYRLLRDAGATQAIIKFETSNPTLYQRLRPHNSLAQRLDLIYQLVALGYELSSGFIFGLPGSSAEDLEGDLALVTQLPLFAASISPFIPGEQSPLRGEAKPTLQATMDAISRLRAAGPDLIIPSVSALNLLDDTRSYAGQALGLRCGANELTVNYTPRSVREGFVIYTSARTKLSLSDAKNIAAGENRRLDLNPPLQSHEPALDHLLSEVLSAFDS